MPDDWMACMRRGDFGGAWRISDRVLGERAGRPCHHLPRHEQWIWDGSPLHGRRVLVRCYHGLGDTIQFARYLPALGRIAARVIVWAPPPLVALLQPLPEVDEVHALHDGAPDMSYDVDVELMELPHVFRSTLATLPARVPYLHAAPAPIERDGRLQVGLVWAAGAWDPRRSIAPSQLAPLAEIPGVRLHVLQRGDARSAWPAGLGVDSGSDDVVHAARVMAALDLVVSVDSMPAHLAGALGRPTWTLLHHDADWRWMTGRGDSPWYPTMRLYRQPSAGAWAPVVARVADDLRHLGADRVGSRYV